MTVKITDAIAIELAEKAARSKKSLYLLDSEVTGFMVRASPSGKTVFRYQYKFGGRNGVPRAITIGEFRFPSLAGDFSDCVNGARRIAAGYRASFRRGEDPYARLKYGPIPRAERTRKWKAAYDAIRALGINF